MTIANVDHVCEGDTPHVVVFVFVHEVRGFQDLSWRETLVDLKDKPRFLGESNRSLDVP